MPILRMVCYVSGISAGLPYVVGIVYMGFMLGSFSSLLSSINAFVYGISAWIHLSDEDRQHAC